MYRVRTCCQCILYDNRRVFVILMSRMTEIYKKDRKPGTDFNVKKKIGGNKAFIVNEKQSPG